MTSAKLIMHYAPGIIAILRQEPCPGQQVIREGIIGHNTCGCDPDHLIHRIVNLSVLDDDEPLRLQQSRLKR